MLEVHYMIRYERKSVKECVSLSVLVSKHVSTRCECGMLSVSSSCLGPKCAVCVRVCVCVCLCVSMQMH